LRDEVQAEITQLGLSKQVTMLGSVNQARQDLSKLNQQMFYYMRGHVAALTVQFEKYKHYGNLRRLFFNLPKYYSGLFIHSLLKGFKNRNVTLLSEILDCLSGLKFYLNHR
jgi:hypothetical protein